MTLISQLVSVHLIDVSIQNTTNMGKRIGNFNLFCLYCLNWLEIGVKNDPNQVMICNAGVCERFCS